MTAQKGRDLLVKIHNGSGFVTLGGLRTKTLNLNARLVDITNSDSIDAWRELLPGAGVKSITVSGAGIFRDGASDALARENFFAQSAAEYQLIIPDFGTLTGAFLISELSYAGRYEGEATYDISLASAGAISFAAL